MNDDVPKTFTEAAGQRVWTQRPPEGYVVIVSAAGGAAMVPEDFLRDPCSGEAILNGLKVEPRFQRGQ